MFAQVFLYKHSVNKTVWSSDIGVCFNESLFQRQILVLIHKVNNMHTCINIIAPCPDFSNIHVWSKEIINVEDAWHKSQSHSVLLPFFDKFHIITK